MAYLSKRGSSFVFNVEDRALWHLLNSLWSMKCTYSCFLVIRISSRLSNLCLTKDFVNSCN